MLVYIASIAKKLRDLATTVGTEGKVHDRETIANDLENLATSIEENPTDIQTLDEARNELQAISLEFPTEDEEHSIILEIMDDILDEQYWIGSEESNLNCPDYECGDMSVPEGFNQ